ncbi:NAD(P)-dependent dehydrogenase, short-chain alcohol dehydrogenase family [Gemmobacter aquatilis]|uniref:NAD(P)-dependent dehydrogenase, short-chain alcohol dehydrogenase family n=1 Tax=Gemmobacter aquatilis TaxID=933059 RepID=A0A1H8DIF6_9RHOB|nr:SDR family NAD(P)-dependent oxidoreductase [Gemmobacter aquatilis]SEN07111.1 NAD(P)-dependent dehydrogenase, short-chain alcohol dehydrogenase family [Gemmobacter aquatilis]
MRRMLITGAGRGIGLALARLATAQGWEVIGTTRGTPPDLPAIRWERLEVTEAASHLALARRLGGLPLEAVICNAGVLRDRGQSLETGYPPDLWAESFAVNVTGTFLTVQTLLPNLHAARGKVMILSSQMGSTTRAPGGSYAYRASKAAVLNLGRNLATDLCGEGIAVGIYHPGWVQTDMGGRGAEISAGEAARGLMERLAALTPMTAGCFETWDGRPHPY